MKDSKLEPVRVPNFEKIHERHAMGLIKGRHPNSFQKNSEIWYRVRNSNNRLDSIKRGASIDTVFESTNGHSVESDVSKPSNLNESSQYVKADTVNSKSLTCTYRTIGGIDLNIKDDLLVKYNGHYALINPLDEALCVDKKNDVRCKLVSDLTPSDKFVFALTHLGDNMADSLNYGEPVWLQLVGSEHSTNKRGVVICSKPWGKVDFSDEFGVNSEVHTNKDKSKKETPTNGSVSKNINNNDTTGITNTSDVRKADIVGHLEVMRVVDPKAEEASITINRAYTKHSWHMGQWVIRSVAAQRNMNVIDSDSKGIPVTSNNYVYLEQDLYCLASAGGSSFRSFPKNTKELQNRCIGVSKQLSTNETLASMMGLGNHPNEYEQQQQQQQQEDLLRHSQKENHDRKKHNSLTTPSSTPKDYGCIKKICLNNIHNTDNTTTTTTTATSSTDKNNNNNNNNNTPNTDIMDLQCMWRLTPVDVEGQINSLSIKDQITVKSMTKASKVLKNSEEMRKIRMAMLTDLLNRENSEEFQEKLQEDKEFSKVLRESILHRSHTRERIAMAPVRTNEINMKSHLEFMMGAVENELIRSKSQKSLMSSKLFNSSLMSASSTSLQSDSQWSSYSKLPPMIYEQKGDVVSSNSNTTNNTTSSSSSSNNSNLNHNEIFEKQTIEDKDSPNCRNINDNPHTIMTDQNAPVADPLHFMMKSKLDDLPQDDHSNNSNNANNSNNTSSLSDQLLALHKAMLVSTVKAEQKAREAIIKEKNMSSANNTRNSSVTGKLSIMRRGLRSSSSRDILNRSSIAKLMKELKPMGGRRKSVEIEKSSLADIIAKLEKVDLQAEKIVLLTAQFEEERKKIGSSS